MSGQVDLAVIGAGPAGMRAAVEARAAGLSVLVVDEQPAPGGQIWRGVEAQAGGPAGAVLGGAYRAGLAAVAAFRASGCDYRPATQLWSIEPLDEGFRLFLKSAGRAFSRPVRRVLLATGAQERPTPFPGWTLPGVMTVGAGQILLKTSAVVPDRPVWIAGTGPLVLLYMVQLLAGGGQVAGWLDTAPRGRIWGNRRALVRGAASGTGLAMLAKGAAWQARLWRAGVRRIPVARLAAAEGQGRLERLSVILADDRRQSFDASLLMVHEGVIPSVHIPLSLGCALDWDAAGRCYRPRLDPWGETSVPGLFVAGDGARILGAEAAAITGARAARRIAALAGGAGPDPSPPAPDRALARLTVLRPFLNAAYAPSPGALDPSDDTIICRCEEITAGQIRAAARSGGPVGPNQVKALTRCGMGPCQGRQCGPLVNNLLAVAQGRPHAEVGLQRVRPPLKPVTLGELAALDGAP